MFASLADAAAALPVSPSAALEGMLGISAADIAAFDSGQDVSWYKGVFGSPVVSNTSPVATAGNRAVVSNCCV